MPNTREAIAPKLDREISKVKQLLDKFLPPINRALRTQPFAEVDPSKLITEFVVIKGSSNDFQEKEKTEKPIRKRYPYYDELMALGIKPEEIESIFYDKSESVPYDRDLLLNPSQLIVPKNFPKLFAYPDVGIPNLITVIDMFGAPQLKEVKEPQIKSFARNVLREQATETLGKIIMDSGLDPQSPIFDHVKTGIYQDLDGERTQFFFFGAQLLGVLDGQTVDCCAFRTGVGLHEGIARILALPVLQIALPSLGFNPIDSHKIMQEVTKTTEEGVELLNESTGINFRSDAALSQREKFENYKLLLSIYLNSQIPLISTENSL